MQQKIQLKYIIVRLQIGLVNWRKAYLLSPSIIPLYVEVYKGTLVFRAKGSNKRVSYLQIKKGLAKTSQCIFESSPDWL